VTGMMQLAIFSGNAKRNLVRLNGEVLCFLGFAEL
jgi:hypothetical protein